MTVATIVVAAGEGTRFGAPKQYQTVGGETLVERCARVAARVSAQVVVVVPPNDVAHLSLHGVTVVAGGATRSASVRAGLVSVREDAAYVLVHDAARPFASEEVYRRVLDALHRGADAVVPGVPMVDTPKQVKGSDVIATLPREEMVRAQTPQGFRLGVLQAVHEGNPDAPDDASLAEEKGFHVVVVEGDEAALKVTYPDDLAVAAGRAGVDRLFRIGLGYDVHPTDESRPLKLGGVLCDGPGLAGYSDADCLIHAIADGLLGAAGLGGIGDVFLDTDPQWEGADSLMMLREICRMLGTQGLRAAQVDATVIAQSPRLSPHLAEMSAVLREVLGASVCVKAKSPEGIGALGARKGIAALAIVVVTG